ncbi:MAG: sugar transferase [Chitinispirillaceae bacterium]
MKAVHRQFLVDSFKLMDMVLLAVALIGAEAAVNPPLTLGKVSGLLAYRFSLWGGGHFALEIFLWHYFFLKLGAYDSKRFTSFLGETKLVAAGVVLCVLVVIAGKVLILDFISLAFLQLFFLSGVFLLVAFRFFLRLLLGFVRVKGRNMRHILIAGTGKRAQEYARLIKDTPQLGYMVRGFVDTSWHGEKGTDDDLPEVVTDFDHFADYLRENVVDEVFACLPIRTHYEQIQTMAAAAEEQGIVVRLTADFFNMKLARAKVEHLGEQPLITLVTGGMYRRMVLYKSFFDYLASLFLLIITSPVLLAAAAAVKVTSRGPVFFLQPRVGMNKRIFRVVKFRTMVVDAEEKMKEIAHLNERSGGAAFKIKDDPRVTRVGKILRKFSIDELPQLINVVKGDMSLVGPRPLPIRDYRGFSQDWQRRRFSVKPGITCIWQVSGRDNIPFEKWMEMDMEYIDKWSLWLDMRILIKTVPAALFGIGAS